MARNSSLLLNELGIGVLWRRTMRRRSCELNEGKRLNLGDTSAAQCNHCEPVYSSWSAQNSQITCNPGAGCISMFTIWMGRVQKMCFRTLNSSENTHYVYITCTIFKHKKINIGHPKPLGWVGSGVMQWYSQAGQHSREKGGGRGAAQGETTLEPSPHKVSPCSHHRSHRHHHRRHLMRMITDTPTGRTILP